MCPQQLHELSNYRLTGCTEQMTLLTLTWNAGFCQLLPVSRDAWRVGHRSKRLSLIRTLTSCTMAAESVFHHRQHWVTWVSPLDSSLWDTVSGETGVGVMVCYGAAAMRNEPRRQSKQAETQQYVRWWEWKYFLVTFWPFSRKVYRWRKLKLICVDSHFRSQLSCRLFKKHLFCVFFDALYWAKTF